MKSLARTTWLALLVAATLAYYFWTAACSFAEPLRLRPRGLPETDHFNLLSHGFLKGQLHLDGEVPPGLIHAPNPYDPRTRPGVEVLHDASYYRGKYYIYFGPAPVVTLFLPFTVLTGRDLPLPLAVWLYCSIGFVTLVGVLLLVQRRHFPRASLWSLTAAIVALGGAGMTVALLRRPNVWELSGAAGFCFFALSLLCLVRAVASPRAAAWGLAGGLALGLAVGSRPTYLVCSAMFALPLLWRQRSGYTWRALAAAAAGCSAIVVALLAYNYARFADPFEFGQKYQLTSGITSEAVLFSRSYVAYNFHTYFLAPLQWMATFPFHQGIAWRPPPSGHGGYEHVIGLLPNLPFVLLAVAGAWGVRRSPVFAAFGLAALGQSALHLCFFGTCIRYMADFTPAFLLLASTGLFLLEEKWKPAAAVRALGLALAGFSAAAAALAVAPLYTPPPHQPPPAYRPIARALNLPYFWTQHRSLQGHPPIALDVTLPRDRTPRSEDLLAVVRAGQPRAQVAIEYLDAARIRLAYRETGHTTPLYSPAVAAAGDRRHTIALGIGGSFADFDGFKGRLRAQFDAQPLWNLAVVSLAAFPGEYTFGPASGFTGEVHAHRNIDAAAFARPALGGARIRFTPTPALAGRWLPLATSGVPFAGDFFAVRFEPDGLAAFGYDHWGEPMYRSPPVRLDPGRAHAVEFWLPPVHPSGDLVVMVDGAVVWRAPVPAFATSPETFHLALNPIGGSTSEPVFAACLVEATQLPPPAGPNQPR